MEEPVGTERDGGWSRERKRVKMVGRKRGSGREMRWGRLYGCRGLLRVENAKERKRERERWREGWVSRMEEEVEATASEQRRCQCARGRRIGLGVGVNVATRRPA